MATFKNRNDKHLVQFTKAETKKHGKGFYYKGKQYVHHSDLHPHETALHRLLDSQKYLLLILVATIIIAFVVNWHATFVILITVITLLYFADLLFNFYLIYRSFSQTPEIRVTKKEIDAKSDREWPSYTIFCPLYKEWEVLPQFVTAMSKMDYPENKLQVMLLLEEDDKETLEHAKKLKLPKYFDIVVVPHSYPKTKPKACNYGLTKATGEYAVIYDAEDVPDPLQLKKAVLAFEQVDPKIVCIQAKLNFYNPHQNFLTRVFTAEYSLWFDLVLTGLQSIDAPIPLGGTSNHFRTDKLKDLKGWDAFNVTEDCDLGVRLVKHGYRTAMMHSVTLEEANSDLKNWFNQRTRWIKGYMQTYFVHMRTPREFASTLRNPHFITFQLVVGGKVFSMLVNPIFWFITINYFLFRPAIGSLIESFYPPVVLYLAFFSLVFGNYLYLYYFMVGCYKKGRYELIKYTFLVPFYWLAMSAAAWVAVYRLIRTPHHWSKTKHGLHLTSEKNTAHAVATLGQDLVDKSLYAKNNRKTSRK